MTSISVSNHPPNPSLAIVVAASAKLWDQALRRSARLEECVLDYHMYRVTVWSKALETDSPRASNLEVCSLASHVVTKQAHSCPLAFSAHGLRGNEQFIS